MIFNLFSRETKKKTQKRELGDKGEDFFVKHLVKQNYKILDRNYLKKWGEIDVVAKKDNIIHFFEVKTVARNLVGRRSEFHDPEENVHRWKKERLSRTIESYLAEKKMPDNTVWQADVAAVFLDLQGNEGAKKLLLKYTNEVHTIPFPLGMIDIDTIGDYERLEIRGN